MAAENVTPDFIVVDGSEGGTGAAPLEFEDHVGMPLTEGLITVHNALVGTGLRDRIRIGASGKVATGSDIVKRLHPGRGLHQRRARDDDGRRLHPGPAVPHQPLPGRASRRRTRGASRALDVPDKTQRVFRFQQATVAEAQRIIASMGLSGPQELTPAMLFRQIDQATARSYAELYHWLEPGELLAGAPEDWAEDWSAADPDRFVPATPAARASHRVARQASSGASA